jgi:hypothetical protein
MGNWVSDGGTWYPANEHAVLPHLTGTDKEVYDGPDRSAMEELAQIYGVDDEGFPKQITVGMPFKDDPMLQDLARQLGYKDVMEYARSRGYDPDKAKIEFQKKASNIIKHLEPERAKEPVIRGGGMSTAPGSESFVGGFGEERVRTVDDAEKGK